MEALDFILANQLRGLLLFCGKLTVMSLSRRARAKILIGFAFIRRCDSRQNICSICCGVRHL
jgi:hypothetical protein